MKEAWEQVGKTMYETIDYYDKLFYSSENQKRLKELVQELEDGKGEYHELIED